MIRNTTRRTFDRSTLPPIETIAERLFGPPDETHGDCLSWRCPFHDERTPSFKITRGNAFFKCFGCGIGGDAIDLIEGRQKTDFKGALAWLENASIAPSRARESPAVRRGKPSTRDAAWMAPEWQAAAWKIIKQCERLLWEPEGIEWLTYLRVNRGLTDDTIRTARIGWNPIGSKIGGIYVYNGILVPWIEGDLVAAINVRRPEGSTKTDGTPAPRYMMIRGSRRGIYPSRETIATGKPLVVTEGEFEALLLAQSLTGILPVITLGSTSCPPSHETEPELRRASTLLIAADADAPGDEYSHKLAKIGRSIRVRPPIGKDWGDVHAWNVEWENAWKNARKIDIRRWWIDRLAGDQNPPLFSWAELSEWRWGPAIDDRLGGIDFKPPKLIQDEPDRLDDQTPAPLAASEPSPVQTPAASDPPPPASAPPIAAAGSSQLFAIDTCKPMNYCGR